MALLPRRRLQSARAGGFTLIELIVVVSIIGLLVGLLLPAVQRARESARQTACINNQRQIALALLSRHTKKQEFPAGWRGADAGGSHEVSAPTGWGWAGLMKRRFR